MQWNTNPGKAMFWCPVCHSPQITPKAVILLQITGTRLSVVVSVPMPVLAALSMSELQLQYWDPSEKLWQVVK